MATDQRFSTPTQRAATVDSNVENTISASFSTPNVDWLENFDVLTDLQAQNQSSLHEGSMLVDSMAHSENPATSNGLYERSQDGAPVVFDAWAAFNAVYGHQNSPKENDSTFEESTRAYRLHEVMNNDTVNVDLEKWSEVIHGGSLDAKNNNSTPTVVSSMQQANESQRSCSCYKYSSACDSSRMEDSEYSATVVDEQESPCMDDLVMTRSVVQASPIMDTKSRSECDPLAIDESIYRNAKYGQHERSTEKLEAFHASEIQTGALDKPSFDFEPASFRQWSGEEFWPSLQTGEENSVSTEVSEVKFSRESPRLDTKMLSSGSTGMTENEDLTRTITLLEEQERLVRERRVVSELIAYADRNYTCPTLSWNSLPSQ